MEKFEQIVSNVDSFVWGPVMLVLLVGTGIFLTIRTRALSWRNLGYALKKTLSKEARTKSGGTGDVSPFSALTTALAATIGTGNIVGVATAMVSGGAGALVPITGFANSVAAPAVEFKKEGQVFGIGCKIFTIAGPVILYGIFTSWVLGLCYWILKSFGII